MSAQTFDVEVYMRHVPSGECRVYRTTEYVWSNGWSDFIWSEGNYSCDCNRRLFFERAASAETSDDADGADSLCGDGEFRIDKIVRVDTGETIYSEAT